jgi:hypothetical protein
MEIFNWTPGPDIINANTATPLVYPANTNFVQGYTKPGGCGVSRDSVRVTPKE